MISSDGDHRYMVRRVPPKLALLIFFPIFVCYSVIFLVSVQFPTTVSIDTLFERLRENSSFSCFQPPFLLAIAHCLTTWDDFSRDRNHRNMVWRASPKLALFSFFPFSWAIVHSFRFPGNLYCSWPPIHGFSAIAKNSPFHVFCTFW
jgi:hypothetical protein